MEKVSLRRKHLVLLATIFAYAACAVPAAPARAQQKSAKPMTTITVTAAPIGNLREIQRLTVTGNKFLAVSASIPVPYGDLNLAQATGANELDRRVKVAARMACDQIVTAYPPHIYPVIGTDDCLKVATDNGLAEAGSVIAAAKR